MPWWLAFNYSGLSAPSLTLSGSDSEHLLQHDQRQLQVPQPLPGLGGNLPHVDGRGLLSRAAESSRQRGEC